MYVSKNDYLKHIAYERENHVDSKHKNYSGDATNVISFKYDQTSVFMERFKTGIGRAN